MKKVLIVYGTRYGSTEEISQYIADILEKDGFNTTLLNLKGLDPKKNPTLTEYDGILIGSGIKIGMWTKDAKKFLEINKEFLKKSKIGVFVSSGDAGNSEKISKAREDYIEKILAEKEITANIYDAFGGVIDLSKSSRIGYLAKKMIKMVAKNDPNIKIDERNDFRDWDQIKNFAEKYAELVKNQ